MAENNNENNFMRGQGQGQGAPNQAQNNIPNQPNFQQTPPNNTNMQQGRPNFNPNQPQQPPRPQQFAGQGQGIPPRPQQTQQGAPQQQFAQNRQPQPQQPQGQPRPQMTPNAPNAANTNPENKKTLSEEDKERLYEFNKDNSEIKKQRKRVKKPTLTENARPLYKVRRLYSARFARRMDIEQMLEIARLRARANEGGKTGAALIGAAAKKTRRLVASLLIVFAILAVIGTGTLVTVLMLQEDRNNYNLDGEIVITNVEEVEAPIGNYMLGSDVEVPLNVRNDTGQTIILRLAVSMTANEALQFDIDEGLTDLRVEDLKFSYILSSSNSWYQETENGIEYLYYVGQLADDATISLFSGYKIDLVDPNGNYNDWANNRYGVELTFNVEVWSVNAVDIDSLDWAQGWKDLYTNVYV